MTYLDVQTRVKSFADDRAVYMRDLDYNKITRCIFLVEVDQWTPEKSAMGAYLAPRQAGVAVITNECKRYQEPGAWILNAVWTVLPGNGGSDRKTVEYRPVPNATTQ